MNAKQIEAIRQRAEKATLGDWDYDVEDFGISNGNFMVAMADVDAKGYPFINAKEVDLEFIAHAREDIPALLSLVAQQQAEVERLTKALEDERLKRRVDKLYYGVDYR